MADSNHSGIDKVYYYAIITKQCIEKTIYDIYYQKQFPDILSPANLWNNSYEKVTKNSHHKIIILSVQTIFVLSYKTCGIK